jgi:hypothetical protein
MIVFDKTKFPKGLSKVETFLIDNGYEIEYWVDNGGITLNAKKSEISRLSITKTASRIYCTRYGADYKSQMAKSQIKAIAILEKFTLK